MFANDIGRSENCRGKTRIPEHNSLREGSGIMVMHNAPSRRSTAVMALFFLAALVATLTWALAAQVRGEESDEWTSVTLLYHSDVKGKIEPCG